MLLATTDIADDHWLGVRLTPFDLGPIKGRKRGAWIADHFAGGVSGDQVRGTERNEDCRPGVGAQRQPPDATAGDRSAALDGQL